MNLNPIKQNMTEIETDKYFVLFSYKTPVAYINRSTGKAYRTEKNWSKTTTKHVNYWFSQLKCPEGYTFTQVPQDELDNLLDEVK
jgi:hypothetical protein